MLLKAIAGGGSVNEWDKRMAYGRYDSALDEWSVVEKPQVGEIAMFPDAMLPPKRGEVMAGRLKNLRESGLVDAGDVGNPLLYMGVEYDVIRRDGRLSVLRKSETSSGTIVASSTDAFARDHQELFYPDAVEADLRQ
jgi:hypothetical protein